MPKGGTLTIETTQSKSTENTEDWVVLTVTDTGTGMSAEVLEQCFDPFFTTKEKDRGTGLGLSTVYGVLEQSGGHISVSSEPGRGTSFRISLLAAGDENGKSDSEQIPTPAYGRETVLLVEDDRAVRRLLQRSLSTLGYCVIATADGEEGLREFKAHQESIALVLTDVVMPGMSGKEMVDRIYELAPTTRVLFMSGYAESIIAHDGILDDGVQFLPKPFSLANLQSKVWSALNGHE